MDVAKDARAGMDAGGWAGAVMSWAGEELRWAGSVMSWAGAVKAVCILKVKV